MKKINKVTFFLLTYRYVYVKTKNDTCCNYACMGVNLFHTYRQLIAIYLFFFLLIFLLLLFIQLDICNNALEYECDK